jgi:hypothetical protein
MENNSVPLQNPWGRRRLSAWRYYDFLLVRRLRGQAHHLTPWTTRTMITEVIQTSFFMGYCRLATRTIAKLFSSPASNPLLPLLLVFLCLVAQANAATWGVLEGLLDARAGANQQQIPVTSFGAFNIPTLTGSTNGSTDTAAASLELTLVNNNRFEFDARGRSSTDQKAQGDPNAEVTTRFNLPFTIAETARAILTSEVLNSGALNTSVLVTSEPPGLTLAITADTVGQPQSVSRVLDLNIYQEFLINGNILTWALTPGAQIGDIEAGSLVITALADLDGNLAVDADDLAIWSAGFGTPPPAADFMDGDADGDADTDGADFLLWQLEYGPVTISSVGLAMVPEPASYLLAGFGLLGLIFSLRARIRGGESSG